jgi:hypothetical protein
MASTNHHVLFSAHPDQVGVFTRVGGVLVPLDLPGRRLERDHQPPRSRSEVSR